MSSDFDGVVVRNTFLDFHASNKQDEDGEEAIARRPRAVSDLTDTKLPWKIPLSDRAEGMYQITRRRLGSSAGDVPSPTGEGQGLGIVEEEESETLGKKRSSRASRGGGRRSRFETGELSPDVASYPNPGFFPGGLPLGPLGAMPMLPPGYPVPWGFPGAMMPPWGVPGVPPTWGYPGFPGPGAPGMGLPQGPNAYMGGGKSAGKGKKGNKDGSVQKERSQKGPKAQQAPAESGEKAKAAPSAPPQPPGEPTTVMLRNIPNRYTSGSLLALLNEHGFQACYDFVYLPMDFQNGVNLGYAFVNLLRHADALRFKEIFQGFQDWRFDSAKVSEVSWAHPHQGLDEHVERYRNSPVMHPSMPDEYKPMIFDNGCRITFPPPTRVIKAPKLRLGRDRPRDGGREDAPREGAAEPVPAAA
jgi:hypothetical protein